MSIFWRQGAQNHSDCFEMGAPPSFRPRIAPLRDAARAVMATAQVWKQRMRQRQELSMLSEYQLRDFLWNESDAKDEARKPFWKA